MKSFMFCLCISITLLQSCHSAQTVIRNTAATNRNILFSPGPKALVYKTIKDYSRNVPVMMDKERTRIVSYPAPKDIYYRGKLAVPTLLNNGYLLDNRGIGASVAFLDYTYEAYSLLKEVPAMEELIKHIIDKHPLAELWDCGIRTQYSDEVKDLNSLIEIGFTGCKKIETGSILLQKDPDN